MRLWIPIAVAMAVGCQATGPTPATPEVEPQGWIYFASLDGIYVPPARVNVATGAVEMVDLPPALLGFDATFLLTQRFVSPLDGDLSGDARLTGFAETFVYHAATREISTYKEESHPYSVTVDHDHTWAPDGSAIAFQRHQSNGYGNVLALLHPATGQTDTLLSSSNLSVRRLFWLGPDTLIFRPPAPGGITTRFVSLSLATGDTANWTGMANMDMRLPLPPTASNDRRWITTWRLEDTVVAGVGLVSVARLHLLDRNRDVDSALVTTAVGYIGDEGPIPIFPISETFDPSSRFLAYCIDVDKLQIVDLMTLNLVKDLDVPWCVKLNWSWGPEGPPA